jgi:hypothetical protein
MNGQSTRLSQPHLYEGKATTRCHDQPSSLTSNGGPLLGTCSSSLQMATKAQACNGDKWAGSLGPGARNTVALVLKDQKSNSATSKALEEFPATSQDLREKGAFTEAIPPKNTLLNVFDPIPSPTHMDISWSEFSSWIEEFLPPDGQSNFEESSVDGNYSGGVAGGENSAQSKNLDTLASYEKTVGFPLFPLYSCKTLRSNLQQDYLTINEGIIDKHYDLHRTQSSGIYSIESQRTSKFFDDHTEPSARGSISSSGSWRDRDEELIRGRIRNRSSTMHSIREYVEVAEDDEDEVEGQVDNNLTEELTSLIEKTGFMYI